MAKDDGQEKSDFERALSKLPHDQRNVAFRWGYYLVAKFVLELGLKLQEKSRELSFSGEANEAYMDAYKTARALCDEFKARV